MQEPPINIEYWASLYRVYEEDNEQYVEALQEPELVDKARRLWDWKDLSRGIDFRDIAPVLVRLEMEDYLTQNPAKAVENLGSILRAKEVIKGRGLVTPAFLLHLASSGPYGSSSVFPIYDRRVWNAYAYLWRLRGENERLYRAASQSPDRYEEFCYKFRASCSNNDPRRYEQALFMFGGYILNLASDDKPTSIKTIDEVLTHQENALRKMQGAENYAMVNLRIVM